MPIDRTWFNALVDDTGSGTTGTVWNKAAIAGLLDAIDGLFAVNQLWTPTLAFGGASTGITYVAQVGRWSRADQLVVCEFQLTISSKGSAVGVAAIGGLPFPPEFAHSICMLNVVAGVTTPLQPYGVASSVGGNLLYLSHAAANGPRVQVTDAHFANNADVRGSITYRKL